MKIGSDLCSIKRYGTRYKLTLYKHRSRRPGGGYRPPEIREDGRLENNLSRARGRVFELAMCNPWEWFFTGTISAENWDRSDLDAWYKSLSQYVRNLRRNGSPCSYLLVPEQHKNGAWHIHGLLSGFPSDSFRAFGADEYLPLALLRKIRSGTDVREWVGYRLRYGFCSLEPIRNQNRAASYITKYITKSLGSGEGVNLPGLAPGKHLYYSSRGLAGAELMAVEYFHIPDGYKWDYEGEYVNILWKDSDDFGLDGLDETVYGWEEEEGKRMDI